MRRRQIGGSYVYPLALGGTSWTFSAEPPDPTYAVQVIHCAIDEGIDLIDTARAYTRDGHPGHSEAIIGTALRLHRSSGNVMVATKGGHYRDGDAFPVDASPARLRADCATSLSLLGLGRLDLYQLHWPDPKIPLTMAMATFAELQKEGLIRNVGLSNVSVPQLEEARAVVNIASVQNHFSPYDQDDRPMLEYCREHSIAYLSYSPLNGAAGANGLAERFPGAARVAAGKAISVQRLALAWLLDLSPVIIPICGAGRIETVRDAARAADVALSPEDRQQIDF